MEVDLRFSERQKAALIEVSCVSLDVTCIVKWSLVVVAGKSRGSKVPYLSRLFPFTHFAIRDLA